jgi:predicted HicB family RNase H-like nuclease
MQYKGYSAIVHYDDPAGLFYGWVVGIRDVVTFQGTSVAELRQSFKDSVEDYLSFCAERGEQPDQSFSGRLLVRLDPVLHREATARATAANMSLNKWVVAAIRSALEDA